MILPWTDIQDFGSAPKQYAYHEHRAEARLVAESRNVALSPGPFAQQLKNGQGVCIWKAGPPTKQMTPAAPTAISPAVLGKKTVRYACVGYDAYGGLTAASPIGSLARAPAILGANSQAIASISRGADGTLTIVTQKPHNFLLQYGGTAPGNGRNPTIIAVQNCRPLDINGTFAIDSIPGPTTIVCRTGILTAHEGIAAPNSTATVWAFVTVACPPLAGATLGYYIYSDSPSPGGRLVLIGKTIYGECHFTDWGPSIGIGYEAPGYVPTTLPTSAQNAMFTSTVVSGGGSTSIVLAHPAPSSVISTILFDDGPNLVAAAAAAMSGVAGSVLISPAGVPLNSAGYLFNSPITLPEGINFIFACHCIINETMTFTACNQVNAKFAAPTMKQGAQFAQRNYLDIGGLGNPMISIGEDHGNTGGVEIDGLGFTCSSNGQNAVMVRSAFYTKISNCSFSGPPVFGNAIGLIYNGSCSFAVLADSNFEFSGPLVGGWGPPIPALWLRSSDNRKIPNGQDCTGDFLMKGKHTFCGRGILFDHLYASDASNSDGIFIGDAIWDQAATTPTVMFWGQQFIGVDLWNILNDTSQAAVLANWTTYELADVNMRNCYNALQPVVTGRRVVRLVMNACGVGPKSL
jgi:hypothetical protein